MVFQAAVVITFGVLGLFLILPVQPAEAAAVTWDGGGDGSSWSDPLNWSGDTLPTSTDDITIDGDSGTDSTVILDIDFQVDSTGSITVTDDDTLTIASDVTLTNNGDIVNLGQLDNLGTIDNNFRILNGLFVGGPQTPVINNSGTIDNSATGTIVNHEAVGHIPAKINNLDTINNDGTIENGGLNSETIPDGAGLNRATINNGGTINNNNPGTIKNWAFIFNHDPDTNVGGTINNSGNIRNMEVDNENQLECLAFLGARSCIFNPALGTINNDGTIVNGGVIENTGNIDNSASGSFTIGYTVRNDGTITNHNTLDNNGVIRNPGTLINHDALNNNAGGAIFNCIPNATPSCGPGAIGGGTINNFDTIINFGRIDSSATSTIDNSGTIDNNLGGSLDFAGSNSGTINNFGTSPSGIMGFSGTNSGTINNFGTLVTGDAGPFNNLGTIDNFGTLLNQLGRTINNGDSDGTNPGTINTSGTIDNSGIVNNHFSSSFNNDGTIDNDGTLNNNVGGTIDNDGTITNTDTLDNDGTVTNDGTIDNKFNGSINNSGSGMITNTGTINNDPLPSPVFRAIIDTAGVIDNFGTLNNGGSFINRGTINNFDTFANGATGAIGNFGTINNYCDAIFINAGVFIGNPVNNVPCAYSLNLFEGSDPSDNVFNLGQEVRAVAETNDGSVTHVTFRWMNPSGDTVETELVPLSLTGQAEDTFTPNEVGDWMVEAEFDNGVIERETLNVPFMVIPESPIGIIALMASSLAALGGFIMLRRKHGNRPIGSLDGLGI